MTYYTLDVASYQGSLLTADVARAGFDGVNLKTSHGLGQKAVHPDVAGWVTRARESGLAVTTFHWLTADASGAAQATYAYQRLQALGLTRNGHTVDVEAPALNRPIISEYVRAMAAFLGRTVFVYSADWRWEAAWPGAGLSPYLWAAPNPGYPGYYPGDTSALWRAGYGGWPALAVMQYAVEPLTFPDGTTGMIKVSKSAVRDPKVWAALTGGGDMASSQNGWPVATASQQDTSTVAGVAFPNGVLRGDVATVLHYVARRFHAEVEPLHAGWCWGWFVKIIAGSTSISNHASGTAIDFNAPNHPLGASGTFSTTKRAAIRRILDDCDGVVRWGGDYTGRKDEMHFEIDKGAAAVKALATKIRNQEDDMSADDARQGFADAFGAMAASVGVPPTDENRWGRQVRDNVNTVIDYATAPMATAITALTTLVAAQSPATAAEIAAALAPMLNAQIGDGASPAEVEQILRRVFGALDAAA